MKDCRIPKKSNRRKKVCGKPRDWWEDVVWKDAIDLLWIRNRRAATVKRDGWRKRDREGHGLKMGRSTEK
jgi:hypothetical protein